MKAVAASFDEVDAEHIDAELMELLETCRAQRDAARAALDAVLGIIDRKAYWTAEEQAVLDAASALLVEAERG